MHPVDENPPALLDEFRAFCEKRGCEVRRHYDWGGEYEDEEGNMQYAEPSWETLLVKEKRVDGKVYCQIIFMSDRSVDAAWEEAWAMECQLVAAGLERVIEDHAG